MDGHHEEIPWAGDRGHPRLEILLARAAKNPSAKRIVGHTNMTSGSKSNPTEIRNVGMKNAFPKKSVTAINGLALGTRRFNPTPRPATTSPRHWRLMMWVIDVDRIIRSG